jgi:hypothetical protein
MPDIPCIIMKIGSVSPGIEPGYIVFPSHKNNVYMFSKAYCYLCGKRKFLAVRRVGLMTHGKYQVDRPFPVTWLDNVWEPTPPPPCSTGLSRLFNPCFPGLNFRHRHAVKGICDQQFWFSLNPLLVTQHCKTVDSTITRPIYMFHIIIKKHLMYRSSLLG